MEKAGNVLSLRLLMFAPEAEGEVIGVLTSSAEDARRRSCLLRAGHEPELREDAHLVEVDALAADALAVEEEEGGHAGAEVPAGGRHPAQRPEVGPEQIELDDHSVVGVVERDQLVALIREGGARLLVVAAHGRLAVVDIARGDDLVARMLEGPDRRVEVVPVL